MARRIAAGSRLIFQVHYTPNGSEQFDQSRVGMMFVDPKSVEYEVRTASAVNSDLRIPAARGELPRRGGQLAPSRRLLASWR